MIRSPLLIFAWSLLSFILSFVTSPPSFEWWDIYKYLKEDLRMITYGVIITWTNGDILPEQVKFWNWLELFTLKRWACACEVGLLGYCEAKIWMGNQIWINCNGMVGEWIVSFLKASDSVDCYRWRLSAFKISVVCWVRRLGLPLDRVAILWKNEIWWCRRQALHKQEFPFSELRDWGNELIFKYNI
jgi:hypothetical protein